MYMLCLSYTMTTHKTIVISFETYSLIRNNLEKEYRRHHKELDRIPLSIEKLMYEAIRFYCNNTPYEVAR
jgi:hypothetical protein